jgi:UDP-N-acetyl-D-galactosamine dehydrogenase
MEEMIYNRLVNKEAKLAVIGLGYVGLPIALEFARKIKVVGFDINEDRVALMKNNIDPSNELVASDFEGCDISFTHNIEDLKEVQFFIVAVPTPIDQSKEPNIRPLIGATNTVGKVLKEGDYVVCAVSGKKIALEHLYYWNVELQEAYYSSKEAHLKYEKIKKYHHKIYPKHMQ